MTDFLLENIEDDIFLFGVAVSYDDDYSPYVFFDGEKVVDAGGNAVCNEGEGA